MSPNHNDLQFQIGIFRSKIQTLRKGVVEIWPAGTSMGAHNDMAK
jgi:hypothetical protein